MNISCMTIRTNGNSAFRIVGIVFIAANSTIRNKLLLSAYVCYRSVQTRLFFPCRHQRLIVKTLFVLYSIYTGDSAKIMALMF